MINKDLKNKVVLSVFAGAMLFSCISSAAEIVLDEVDITQEKWYESYGLKESGSVLGTGGIYPVIPVNQTDTLNLKNLNGTEFFANVTNVYNSTLINGGVVGGFAEEGKGNADIVSNNTVSVTDSQISIIAGAFSNEYDVNNNIVKANNVRGGTVIYGGFTGTSGKNSANGNKIYITDSDIGAVHAGKVNGEGDANENIVYLNNSKIKEVSYIGSTENGKANGNGLVIENGSTVDGFVLVGVGSKEANNNFVTIIGQNDLSKAQLIGYSGSNEVGKTHSGNTLNIDNFTGKIFVVSNFDIINFENLDFTKKEILNITEGINGLQNTQIAISSIAGGKDIKVGDSVNLIEVTGEYGFEDNFANLNKQAVTNVGVASVVTSDIAQNKEENTITATIAKIERNKQTNLVAENRAVAAAFVNQGTDLIADSLDTLSRDGKYGVKTFAAVHGNRSKYDVNSDIKINGWSTIVGVGAENEHNGGDFSWGVFYENGSGNYRTYNDFNNEFFRGDGSLVYNGGGIAARYENSHGVYTEGSLRAGMLKSEMTDALSDGENKYGYESETAYYGAHIGVGKIFSLGDDSDLDVYGKFFHTYTEGDSFNVAGDEFEFDSINSDRLRIGARVTSNKENKFSTYYGLAYEYEFNGDAEMRAAGMKAPTQSLQGSSVMAEIGLNYQPTPDSPWSFDLNMRGYAGERQGGSFNVQATYTF